MMALLPPSSLSKRGGKCTRCGSVAMLHPRWLGQLRVDMWVGKRADQIDNFNKGWRIAAVASLLGATAAFAGGGVSAQTQSTTRSTTHSSKPETKKKTTPAAKSTARREVPPPQANRALARGSRSPRGIPAMPRMRPQDRSLRRRASGSKSAFIASTQLRPMAQQLAVTRSPQAFSGVLSYAQGHPGEAASAAYLAIGHAYMLDHRTSDAAAMYHQAKLSGKALEDYAECIGAQASIQAGRGADAYPLLDHFAERYPESIFAEMHLCCWPMHICSSSTPRAPGRADTRSRTARSRLTRIFATRSLALINWLVIPASARRSIATCI